MTRPTFTSGSLFSSAATIVPAASPQMRTTIAADGSAGSWHVAEVGSVGRRVYVLRMIHARPGSPFSRLLIELGFVSEHNMVGRMLLPSGLSSSHAIRLRVDEELALREIPISSSTPKGAIVKLELDPGAIASFRLGTLLHISARAASNAKPVDFAVPLKRFASGADQLQEMNQKRMV